MTEKVSFLKLVKEPRQLTIFSKYHLVTLSDRKNRQKESLDIEDFLVIFQHCVCVSSFVSIA